VWLKWLLYMLATGRHFPRLLLNAIFSLFAVLVVTSLSTIFGRSRCVGRDGVAGCCHQLIPASNLKRPNITFDDPAKLSQIILQTLRFSCLVLLDIDRANLPKQSTYVVN
jgi:hypothetical protein